VRTVEVNCQFGPFSFHLVQQEPIEPNLATVPEAVVLQSAAPESPVEMQPTFDLPVTPPPMEPPIKALLAAPPIAESSIAESSIAESPVTKPYIRPKKHRLTKADATSARTELDNGAKDSLGFSTLWQGAGHRLECPRPQGLHCSQAPGAHVRIVGLYKRNSQRVI